MPGRSTFNLGSPNQIRGECSVTDLEKWFAKELEVVPEIPIRETSVIIARHLDAFVRFPQKALLLWSNCDRIPPLGEKQKYHQYPDVLKKAAAQQKIYLDGRPNGPAIASFFFACGERPQRFGSTNCWSIHHLYSGKFPYLGKLQSLHAPKEKLHFTQSVGLVAVHPFADALADEFPAFAWLLRAHAFRKFGYDPDHVFSLHPHDEFGFVEPFKTQVIFS